MSETSELLRQAYAAFNRRDVDGVLALMTPEVKWPKASEGGGTAVGREEVRDYWKRQWQEFDPTVEPLAMTEREDGTVHVRVHQVVKNTQGNLLSDNEVIHVFTMRDGRIASMGIEPPDGASSAAFTR